MNKIVLGETYIDEITGLSGVATAHGEYLHGSPRTQLEFRVEDKVHRPAEWFDDVRLTRVAVAK